MLDSARTRATWGVAIGLLVVAAVGIPAFTWGPTRVEAEALPSA